MFSSFTVSYDLFLFSLWKEKKYMTSGGNTWRTLFLALKINESFIFLSQLISDHLMYIILIR